MRLIDADVLKEDMQWGIDHGIYDEPYDYLTEIDGAPTANEWISISKRLPEECDGRVLVSKEDGEVTTGLYSEFSNVWYIGDMCGVGGCKVIAWMPLPEPYREDGEEK